MKDTITPPVRLCCGQPHWSPACPDGKVLCCICFDRFDVADLHVTSNGHPENVCKECHNREEQLRATTNNPSV